MQLRLFTNWQARKYLVPTPTDLPRPSKSWTSTRRPARNIPAAHAAPTHLKKYETKPVRFRLTCMASVS